MFKHPERELGFFSPHEKKITKLSIFILCCKSEYSVSPVMSRRPFCFTRSYSLFSFIDCCDVAWILLVLQCFFLVVLRGSKSKQQKKRHGNSLEYRNKFSLCWERQVHRKLLILFLHWFMLVLLYSSFPLWRRVLRTPPLPSLRQSAPSYTHRCYKWGEKILFWRCSIVRTVF